MTEFGAGRDETNESTVAATTKADADSRRAAQRLGGEVVGGTESGAGYTGRTFSVGVLAGLGLGSREAF